ncbi:hypothetical protein DERF_013451 [Dermatophagoides farinae]|uniref:Uncharacterized protein n=1 Tax=Dermatophagoides farinae TaxID=6954 RepID=A0A922KYK9_DERFA|nr:hypothetical protein DERF_013451 [Dermatophagoides farinae]
MFAFHKICRQVYDLVVVVHFGAVVHQRIQWRQKYFHVYGYQHKTIQFICRNFEEQVKDVYMDFIQT